MLVGAGRLEAVDSLEMRESGGKGLQVIDLKQHLLEWQIIALR